MAQFADPQRAVLVFAFVSEGLKSNNDVLEGLMPLFAPIARDLHSHLFNPADLVTQLSERYGLETTTDVAEFLIPRLKSFKLLREEDASRTLFWHGPQTQHGANHSIESAVEEIFEKLHQFVASDQNLVSMTLSKEDVEQRFSQWLVRNDELVQAATTSIAGGKRENSTQHNDESSYLIAKFVQDLRKNNQDLFARLSDITIAAIATEVIVDLQNPTFNIGNFDDLNIFLDGPLCMDYLGLSGADRKKNASFIINALKENGARIYVFSHSAEEIHDNLKALLDRPARYRTGPTATAIMRGEVAEAFAIGVRNDSEGHICAAGIEVFDSNITAPVNQRHFFSDDIASELRQRLAPVRANDLAAERDVRSIQKVMRRRRGVRTRNPFESKYLMITENVQFSRIVHRLCEEENLIQHAHVGPVIDQKQIAATLWLAMGSEAKSEISARQLLVNCSKALELNPSIANKIKTTLSAIHPEHKEQFESLLSQPRFIQISNDLLLGSERWITNATAEKVFQEFRQEIADGEQKKFEQKLHEHKKKSTEKINKVREAAATAEAAKNEAIGKMVKLQVEHDAMHRGLWERARKTTGHKMRITKAIAVLAFLAAAIFSVASFTQWEATFLAKTFAAIVPTIIFGLSLTWPLDGLLKKLETKWLQEKYENLCFEMDVTPEDQRTAPFLLLSSADNHDN